LIELDLLQMEQNIEKTEIYDKILETRGKDVESLHVIASILNTGLNRKVLAVLLELIESGVNPESLVDGEFYDQK
jgi:hypothetical protein